MKVLRMSAFQRVQTNLSRFLAWISRTKEKMFSKTMGMDKAISTAVRPLALLMGGGESMSMASIFFSLSKMVVRSKVPDEEIDKKGVVISRFGRVRDPICSTLKRERIRRG